MLIVADVEWLDILCYYIVIAIVLGPIFLCSNREIIIGYRILHF